MSSADNAMTLFRKNLEEICAGKGYCLYQGAFYAGQVQRLMQVPSDVLFNEMRAAFLMGIKGTEDAHIADDQERLALYTEDISEGLKAGAQFPVTVIRTPTDINNLNPLRVNWHAFPTWLRVHLKQSFNRRTHPLAAFEGIVGGITGHDLFSSAFDHWGSDVTDTLLISEPYDFKQHDGEFFQKFCDRVNASYRLAPVPYHHHRTQRVEIGRFSKGGI